MQPREMDSYFDLNGLMPPLPLDVSQKLLPKLQVKTSGSHTFLPALLTRAEFKKNVLPVLENKLSPAFVKFITDRIEKTFFIRNKLKLLQNEIIKIVGEGNFSALWLDREAYSADSMENRALMTEAVIHIYSPKALQRIVTLLYKHDIPMIPYGEGGGYNMGVTPMAPAVTISLRGIDHISVIRPSRRTKGAFEISVGAGVPFKDLIDYLDKRGFVLRCNPNTPRAATGGIAASGSNGGRKAYEVIVHGRAVTFSGTALCFATDEKETELIQAEPFLQANKFFSIQDVEKFKVTLNAIQKKNLVACTTPQSEGVIIPLQGMKAATNMLAQKAQKSLLYTDVDTMADAPTLPISAFVGAEGCTGFIYELTFEIEKPLPWLQASRWHFKSVEAAMLATRAIKKLPHNEHPIFFEFVSGQSIRRYLIQDFPSVFAQSDEAVLFLAVEGEDKEDCARRHLLMEDTLQNASKDFENALRKRDKTSIMLQNEGIDEFEIMRKPREELPKKLRTKCKTDMEIRTEYLEEVLKIVENTNPKGKIQKQDVLFGHLTPNHTAIMHWNIGGFDLYDEEQADIAWDYLEDVLGRAQDLAPPSDKKGSARFTGEHGIAGKAAYLWINHIAPDDFNRMCAVKDLLDPKDLFNPATIFLRTSHVRALRARLFNTSAKIIKEQDHAAENFAIAEALKCTRCNSCKICPVIDAEHELEREQKRKSKKSVLPSKRDIVMFLERIVLLRKVAQQSQDPKHKNAIIKVTKRALQESAALLSKCFYCRRCDKACPVDIHIHPMVAAYHTIGKLPKQGSKIWKFILNRLMGEDIFKSFTYRMVAFFSFISMPLLVFIRKLKFIPDWFKTYTVPPKFAFVHYEPAKEGIKLQPADNFVVITNDDKKAAYPNLLVRENEERPVYYIRYRGCMDTFGNPNATTSVDTYFKETLNVRIVDLEKKLCCGFPFAAEGLEERAKQSQIISLVEIAKCIFRLLEEKKQNEVTNFIAPEFVLFSNCPTCCEAIREMGTLIKVPETSEKIRLRAKLPTDFDMNKVDFTVQDTAEIVMGLASKLQHTTKSDLKVGLKVPCHNTSAATQAQLDLLKIYFKDVSSYDRCCGLSGIGRIKHPKIGTKISEKLFEMIGEAEPDVVVTGCPSCRDGVKIQRDIFAAKKETQGTAVADFEIAGIFEQIIRSSDEKKKSDSYTSSHQSFTRV